MRRGVSLGRNSTVCIVLVGRRWVVMISRVWLIAVTPRGKAGPVSSVTVNKGKVLIKITTILTIVITVRERGY